MLGALPTPTFKNERNKWHMYIRVCRQIHNSKINWTKTNFSAKKIVEPVGNEVQGRSILESLLIACLRLQKITIKYIGNIKTAQARSWLHNTNFPDWGRVTGC